MIALAMFSERLQQLKPYVPGEQPTDRPYIKLNANESPYSPSPRVQETVANFSVSSLNVYPDPDSTELKKSIASLLNACGGLLPNYTSTEKNTIQGLPFEISDKMIFCGNGSDEVLSFIFYALFSGKDPLVIPEYTYSFYPVYAGYYNIPLKKIPLKADFSLDVDALVNEKSCGLIFANPNAPTALALSCGELEDLLNRYPKDRFVVVDEAYVDFGAETAIPLLEKFSNLVIVRTFSKSMSFAGMRLGYAIANEEVINAFTTVKNSFNHFPVDALCQKLGIAACSDPAWYGNCCRSIIKTRDDFVLFLQQNGWIVSASKTNFVLAAKKGFSGKALYEHIKKEGILVRHFDMPLISDYIRISIGTDAQMEELKKALLSL